jgi:integrase
VSGLAGRPSKTETFRPLVEGLLQQQPSMTSTELLRRTKDAGYDGGHAALFALIAAVRKQPAAWVPLNVQLGIDAATRDTLTLTRAWDAWCNANTGRVRSIDSDRGRVRHLFRLFGLERRLATLTLEDVDAYRAQRRREITVRKGPPSPATRNREVELLARLVAFAVTRRLLRSNPLEGLEFEPEDNIREVVVKEELLERILAACVPWLRAFVLVAIDSGMRREEVVRLRWEQIDDEQGLISVFAVDTKTRQARNTILSDRARDAIAALPRTGRWVFMSPVTGQHLHADFVGKTFRLAMVDAGITAPDGRQIWLHDLRRSFATNSRRRGIPEAVVMRMTGHRTQAVFERYNIVAAEDILRARQVLGADRRVANPNASEVR